ncbi:MAG: beta-ketoacyl-ACP synthase III [Planctomycetota bacterium]|nr:MAG: beta-ketoacyl-ACP synthase III [Planctomycetota bacterium]
MTNEDWTRYVDTSDEWIVERTGIHQRRFAGEKETTVDLGMAAARLAMEEAAVQPGELREIIVATDTPEVYNPDTAAYIQHQIGAGEVPAYDLAGSGCAGFLQAVDLACSRVAVRGGPILVLGVEAISKIMSWQDRNTCVLFGDGAGAMVIDQGQDLVEVLAVTTGTDGSKADILGKEIGGTRVPFSKEVAEDNVHNRVVMNGREVFKEAVSRMSAAAHEVLNQVGWSTDDIDLFVPHQANIRILHSVAKSLGFPLEKVYINVQDYGNTGSASVPLALWEARNKGMVPAGSKVLLTAFGAGFHWAAVLLQF